MSDAAEPAASDADAWATACEEDLAAEKARRRAEQGQHYADPAEELRRLADAVSEKVAELGRPFGATVASAAAQGMAQQLIAQAKAAIEPVVERNPQVFDHLTAAGGELLAAYRAAVQEAEGRWTAGAPGGSGAAAPDARSAPDASGGKPKDGAPRGLEHIDLDKDPADRDGPQGSTGQEGSGGADDPYGSGRPPGESGPDGG